MNKKIIVLLFFIPFLHAMEEPASARSGLGLYLHQYVAEYLCGLHKRDGETEALIKRMGLRDPRNSRGELFYNHAFVEKDVASAPLSINCKGTEALLYAHSHMCILHSKDGKPLSNRGEIIVASLFHWLQHKDDPIAAVTLGRADETDTKRIIWGTEKKGIINAIEPHGLGNPFKVGEFRGRIIDLLPPCKPEETLFGVRYISPDLAIETPVAALGSVKLYDCSENGLPPSMLFKKIPVLHAIKSIAFKENGTDVFITKDAIGTEQHWTLDLDKEGELQELK